MDMYKLHGIKYWMFVVYFGSKMCCWLPLYLNSQIVGVSVLPGHDVVDISRLPFQIILNRNSRRLSTVIHQSLQIITPNWMKSVWVRIPHPYYFYYVTLRQLDHTIYFHQKKVCHWFYMVIIWNLWDQNNSNNSPLLLMPCYLHMLKLAWLLGHPVWILNECINKTCISWF